MSSLIRSRFLQLALALLLTLALGSGLALPADAADGDGDGFEDGVDVCPFTFDDQADEDSDGIGDACQCGDVDDDGLVTEADGLAIKEAALSLDPYLAAVGLPGFDKCDVGGSEGCTGLDGSIVIRAVNGHAPTLQQVCPAASAAVTNNLALAEGPSGPIGLVDAGPVQLGHPVAIRIGIEASEVSSDVALEFFIVNQEEYDRAEEGGTEEVTQYILGATAIATVNAGSEDYTVVVAVPGADLNGDPIPPGEYYLFPVIDPGKEITETNETDNVATETEFATITVADRYQGDSIVALEDLVLDFSGISIPAELLPLPDQDPDPPDPCPGDYEEPRGSFSLDEEVVANLRNSTVGITAVLIASGPEIPSVELQAKFDHPRLTGPIDLEFWDTDGDQFSRELRIANFEPGRSTSVHMDLLLPIDEPGVADAIEAALEELATACSPGCPGFPDSPDPVCVSRCMALELLSEAEAAELEITVTAYDAETGGSEIPRSWTPPAFQLPEDILQDVTIISPLFTPPPEVTGPQRFEADFQTGFHSALVSAGLEANGFAALDEEGASARTEALVPVSLFGLDFNFLYFDAQGSAFPHDLELGFSADLKFATAADGSGGIVILSQPLINSVCEEVQDCSPGGLCRDGEFLCVDEELLKWCANWNVEKSKEASADFVVGVVPMTVSMGASGQLGFLAEVGVPVCDDSFGDTTSFQAHTGPYFDVGMLASAAVGSSKAFAVGIEGEATLIEDTFFAKAEVMDLAFYDATSTLEGTLLEDITNTLDGPKGGLYLYVGYPCFKWCRWFGIPYPCGFKQCKSRTSIFKFRTYTKEDVILCKSQSTTIEVGP